MLLLFGVLFTSSFLIHVCCGIQSVYILSLSLSVLIHLFICNFVHFDVCINYLNDRNERLQFFCSFPLSNQYKVQVNVTLLCLCGSVFYYMCVWVSGFIVSIFIIPSRSMIWGWTNETKEFVAFDRTEKRLGSSDISAGITNIFTTDKYMYNITLQALSNRINIELCLKMTRTSHKMNLF